MPIPILQDSVRMLMLPQPNSNIQTDIPDGKYFSVCRARDVTNQEGQLGRLDSYMDNAAPATAPGLVTPGNGVFTIDNTPDFDWNDISHPESHIRRASIGR